VSRRTSIAAVAAAALCASGCGADLAPTRAARPTEVETREAYLGTPVIVDEQGRRIAIGTTRSEIRDALGFAAVTYLRRVRGVYRQCEIYPINGTQRWDRYGSPVADEWEFCFDRGNRLLARRRLAALSAATGSR
jgi:hypothetical protein